MIESIDKFQIIKYLGNGAFGEVLLCYDPLLKKEIAIKIIKVLNPYKIAEAIKEAQVLDHCRHKHIVEVFDVRVTNYNGDLVVIIIMEYLAKGSIQSHIEKRFISVKDASGIIQQSLLGLEHAHNNNFLHRDVKPGNILFSDGGEAKLSDFGLALNYHDEISDLRGYRPHQPLEVIEGEAMSRLSDIYAVGITYYRLLNNIKKLPFMFKDKNEWLKAVKKGIYPNKVYSEHIPDKINRIVNKAIQAKKDKRFQDCFSFRQSIEKLKYYVDWMLVNEDEWTGVHNEDQYSLIKYRVRTGWKIDFKRNSKRKTEYCCTQLPDDKVDKEFFKIIRETTLM